MKLSRFGANTLFSFRRHTRFRGHRLRLTAPDVQSRVILVQTPLGLTRNDARGAVAPLGACIAPSLRGA